MLVGVAPAERPNIPVTFEDVSKAAHDIRGAVYVTPCARNPELSELTGCNLWLKVGKRRLPKQQGAGGRRGRSSALGRRRLGQLERRRMGKHVARV